MLCSSPCLVLRINFYNDNKILDKSESEKLTILAVTHTVKEVIADSLNLLGVKALEEM